MKFREREEGQTPPAVRPSPEGGPPATEAVLEEGSQLLAAADEAIRRALSANSDDFLAASRQQGGQ
jgi:hypothetical protein